MSTIALHWRMIWANFEMMSLMAQIGTHAKRVLKGATKFVNVQVWVHWGKNNFWAIKRSGSWGSVVYLYGAATSACRRIYRWNCRCDKIQHFAYTCNLPLSNTPTPIFLLPLLILATDLSLLKFNNVPLYWRHITGAIMTTCYCVHVSTTHAWAGHDGSSNLSSVERYDEGKDQCMGSCGECEQEEWCG